MIKWTALHEAKRQRIIERLSREAPPFEDMSDEAQKGRRQSPFLEWCATYLPHYFSAPFAPFHERMVDVVGETDMPTYIGAFRGAGKSVLLALARPLWRTLRREVPFWIYGACVQKLAAQNMDNVRIELEHNRRIACDYPGLRVNGPEEEWVVEYLGHAPSGQFRYSSCKFEAFGIGMSPRGRRHGAHRPLEFVGDDLENAELARNPERESNLWHWMTDEVIPALEPDVWIFTVLGTMFGADCMIERARRAAEVSDPSGRPLAKLFVQAAMEGGRSVWPERFSRAGLARVRSMIGLRDWNRNYAMTAQDPDKPFQPEWIDRHRYDEADLPAKRDIVCFLDPAHSEAPTGCPRALVAVAADIETGHRYVLDAWITRGSPREMLAAVFQFADRFDPRVTGIEINGGYALLKPLIEMERRYIPTRYVNQDENKDLRIQRLCAPMEQGRWHFPRQPSAHVQTLEAQLLSYPDGWVDGPDALASADRMLPNTWGRGRKPGEPLYKSVVKRRDLAGVL